MTSPLWVQTATPDLITALTEHVFIRSLHLIIVQDYLSHRWLVDIANSFKWASATAQQPRFGWLKQGHKPSPKISMFIGRMYKPFPGKWVVYGIVLPTSIIIP